MKKLSKTIVASLLLLIVTLCSYGGPVMPAPTYVPVRIVAPAVSPFIYLGLYLVTPQPVIDALVYSFGDQTVRNSNPGNWKIERESGSRHIFFYQADSDGTPEYHVRAFYQFQKLNDTTYMRKYNINMITGEVWGDTGWLPTPQFNIADWGLDYQVKTTYWNGTDIVRERWQDSHYVTPILRPINPSAVLFPTEVMVYFNGRQWEHPKFIDQTVPLPYQEYKVVLWDPFSNDILTGVSVWPDEPMNYSIDALMVAPSPFGL